MIANARMYSVCAEAAAAWRELLAATASDAGWVVELYEHPAPAPLEELWRRPDLGAVFMCGLPFSRALPQPVLLAAPVPRWLPSPLPRPDGAGTAAVYWSELVVRRDSPFRCVEDSFGHRIALTVPGSQSGCMALLTHLMGVRHPRPLYEQVIEPRITPQGALAAVIEGAADIAPIDSYAFALLQQFRPEWTARVRSIGRTQPSPIPPLVAVPQARSPEALTQWRASLLDAHRTERGRELVARVQVVRFASPSADDYAILRTRGDAALAHWRGRRFAKIVHPAFDFLN